MFAFYVKDILGFDVHGAIVNRPDAHVNQAIDWTDICQKSTKVNIHFFVSNEGLVLNNIVLGYFIY